MLSLPVETDFAPVRRYEGYEQHHAVVARGQAGDSQHDRSGARHRERREDTPHDEAVLSAQAIEHQQGSAEPSESQASGPLGALGQWLAKTLEDMSSTS